MEKLLKKSSLMMVELYHFDSTILTSKTSWAQELEDNLKAHFPQVFAPS